MKIYSNHLKSFFDILVGVVVSIFTFPIICVVMLVIRAESKGSPIFAQIRVGQFGKSFKIYKLRSMVINSGEVFATQDADSRITKTGHFIRKTSLDEFPQFWNLALGQMSLIGPRPDVLVQKGLYSEQEWEKRLLLKPGITGLAQALYRSQATFLQRKKLDLFYINKVSARLDFKIVCMTLATLLKKGRQN